MNNENPIVFESKHINIIYLIDELKFHVVETKHEYHIDENTLNGVVLAEVRFQIKNPTRLNIIEQAILNAINENELNKILIDQVEYDNELREIIHACLSLVTQPMSPIRDN